MHNPLATLLPTNKEPINPGPCVTAMADSDFVETPACFSAWSMTGMILLWCALEANSGTTPPYCSCTD